MMRASVEQQQDIIRYMGDLNDWFGRDRVDRQNEMRAILGSISDLRRQYPGGFQRTHTHSFPTNLSLTFAFSRSWHATGSSDWCCAGLRCYPPGELRRRICPWRVPSSSYWRVSRVPAHRTSPWRRRLRTFVGVGIGIEQNTPLTGTARSWLHAIRPESAHASTHERHVPTRRSTNTSAAHYRTPRWWP